jgi:phage terminase Nu1 subunit (DNA packaging protein)
MGKMPKEETPAEAGKDKRQDVEAMQRFADACRRARAGQAAHIDRAIRDAGYGDPPGEDIVINSRQLERGLALSRRQIQDYISAGMPRLSAAHGARPATFDLWAAMRWLREHFRRAGGLDPDEAAANARQRREAELRKIRADAEIKERQAALEAGRVVNRDRVESEFRFLLLEFQACIEGLPGRLSAIAPPGMADRLATEAREILREDWNAVVDRLRRILPPKSAAPTAPEVPGTAAMRSPTAAAPEVPAVPEAPVKAEKGSR